MPIDNCSGSFNVVAYSSNFAKIISQLNIANPSAGYTIEGNDRINFTNISEQTCDAILGLDLDPNPATGGSFITMEISDIQTNVNSNGTNNINTIQHYHSVICDHSSMQTNYQTALSFNSVIQNIGSGSIDVRYKINAGNTIGSVIDYATSPFASQSTQNVEKLLSGSFTTNPYTPPHVSSILVNPMVASNMGGGPRRLGPRRVGGRM
jgi:hypothetical protein